MTYALLLLALVVAVINWAAVVKSWKRAEYVTKPAVMVLLLAWFWQFAGVQDGSTWFLAGILFSMGGDIALLLPKGWFLVGLVLFLFVQLSYIVGFGSLPPPVLPGGMILLAISVISIVVLYLKFSAGLKQKNLKGLNIPVFVYIVMITLMVLSAWLTFLQPDWSISHAALVSAGALLFFASDGILAWNRFIQPVPHERSIVMATYHLGQMGIILGAALHFVQS